MKALRWLFKTSDSFALTLARLTLGIVMFPHGAQKVLGWFGGYGFNGTMNFFTQQGHIPAPFAFLAILAEFAGSIGLILGCASRIAAFGIGTNMVVAILTVHGANGFFMNWSGQQKGEGFEYHLLAIGLALIVILCGAGKGSLDSLIARGWQNSRRYSSGIGVGSPENFPQESPVVILALLALVVQSPIVFHVIHLHSR